MIWPGSDDRVIWPGSRDWAIWPGSGDGMIWRGSGWNWGEVLFRKRVKCVVKTRHTTEIKFNHPRGFFAFFFPCLFCLFVLFLVSMFSSSSASELRCCVKAEVDVLGSLSLTVCMVSVDVKQHWTRTPCSVPLDLLTSQAFNFYPLWDTTSGKRLLLPLGLNLCWEWRVAPLIKGKLKQRSMLAWKHRKCTNISLCMFQFASSNIYAE